MANTSRLVSALQYLEDMSNSQKRLIDESGRKYTVPAKGEAPAWYDKALSMEGRATFLPFKDTLPGSVFNKRELALPGIVAGAVNALTAPGRALSGSDPTFNAPEEAANVAMNVMGGGIGVTAVKPAPAGSLGMFIGKTAKTWNPESHAQALQMEKAGSTPTDIWGQTGNWKGPEGAWRQEITDNLSRIRGDGDYEDVIMKALDRGIERTQGKVEYPEPYTTTVNDVFSHDRLQNAYPQIMDIESQILSKNSGAKGQFLPETPQVIQINEKLMPHDAKSTMLHELQHAVQEKEGFAKGGSTELAMKEANSEAENIAKKLNEMTYGSPAYEKLYKKFLKVRKNITVDEAYQMYRRYAGEAEARATQSRRNKTDKDRRLMFPEESYDVPMNELIVRNK